MCMMRVRERECMLIETHNTTPAKCNMTWIGAHSTAGSPDE